MSAAALRPAAGWRDAVRAQTIVLASVRPLGWVVVFLFGALFLGADAHLAHSTRPPFDLFRSAVRVMFLLPLVWQGRGGRTGDAPLPVPDTCRTLVRVLTGAVFAGLVLGLGLGLYVLYARWDAAEMGINLLEVFPASYPVALAVAGMANYLLGAAIVLRAERPGRVLLAGLCVGGLVLAAAGIQLDHVEFDRYGSGTLEAPRPTGSTTLTLTAALVRLALGMAAVGVATWWGGPRDHRWPGWARLRAPFPAPARALPVTLAVPRPRTRLATGLIRHLLLLAPRMVVPLLIAAYYAWVLAPGEVVYQQPSWENHLRQRVISPEPLQILMLTAALWPVLVWLDERRIRPWDDAHPVGTLSRRILHAAAGLLWLQAVGLVVGAAFVARAVRAEMLPSPLDLPTWLWLGLPLALLTLYCLGTLATAAMENLVTVGVVWAFSLLPVLAGLERIFSEAEVGPGPLAPTRLLIAVNWFGENVEAWSTPAALLWTPVFVAAALLALWFRAWRDLHGWSPSLLELIRHHRRPR